MTKGEWADLTPKQQWDVIVALRGPDCQHSEPIKWLTTGVIRWAVHTIMRVGGTINEDLKGIVIPQDCYTLDREIRTKIGARILSWAPSHYFQHIHEAGEVLRIKVWSVPNDVWLKAVDQHQPPHAVLHLWSWLNEMNPTDQYYLPFKEELTRHLQTYFGWDPARAAAQSTSGVISQGPNKLYIPIGEGK